MLSNIVITSECDYVGWCGKREMVVNEDNIKIINKMSILSYFLIGCVILHSVL